MNFFIQIIKSIKAFGFPILINKKYQFKKKKFLNYLNKVKIETRPILSGNFLNQPSAKLYNLNKQNTKFTSAQEIEDSFL